MTLFPGNQSLFLGNQHDIITSKPALPIGNNFIAAFQFHHKPQHKAVVKPLRRIIFGRAFCNVKAAESRQGNIVHELIHGFYIIQQQRLDKVVIGHVLPAEPVTDHIPKHHIHFPVCQFQMVGKRPCLL